MILVHAPGAFTTVQDLGRPGHGLAGVSRAGAADPVALRLGNRLLGNPEGAAALEMTLIGGSFHFPDGAEVAVTGAGCGVPAWTPLRIAPGDTLRLGPMSAVVRSYLCVRGGILVPLVGGSASTHVPGGMGGFEGRPLRKGDALQAGPPAGPSRRGILPGVLASLAPRTTIRVTPGLQSGWFSAAARALFLNSEYQVSNDSNRLGIRLEGPPVPLESGGQMITEGVPLGAVQIASGGQPILLFVDQQTTGGYPKIANVITADLPSLGQLRPGDRIRFAEVLPAEARRLLLEQESRLRSQEIFL